MTREEIEEFPRVKLNCFETDREEDWYTIGCIDGLEAADEEPNLERLWHNAGEEPKENSKIAIVDTKGEWWNIDYSSDVIDDFGLYGWDLCKAYFKLKAWAYIKDLLPKGGEK